MMGLGAGGTSGEFVARRYDHGATAAEITRLNFSF